MFLVSVILFPFILSAQIDPELQRYFEKNYGYMKEDMRNSPVSYVSNLKESLLVENKNSLITYTSIYLKDPDYSSLPLYYDIKKQNTGGAISSYVLELQFKEGKLNPYIGVDIKISKTNYSRVIEELTSKYGFVFAGEENFVNDSSSMIIFGWVEESKFNDLGKIKGVEKFSISNRNLQAPLTTVTLILKVPNNRDIVEFVEKFSLKLGNYGFLKNSVDIISNDKKYRFAILKLNGKIPIDKISILFKEPFVIEIKS